MFVNQMEKALMGVYPPDTYFCHHIPFQKLGSVPADLKSPVHVSGRASWHAMAAVCPKIKTVSVRKKFNILNKIKSMLKKHDVCFYSLTFFPFLPSFFIILSTNSLVLNVV